MRKFQSFVDSKKPKFINWREFRWRFTNSWERETFRRFPYKTFPRAFKGLKKKVVTLTKLKLGHARVEWVEKKDKKKKEEMKETSSWELERKMSGKCDKPGSEWENSKKNYQRTLNSATRRVFKCSGIYSTFNVFTRTLQIHRHLFWSLQDNRKKREKKCWILSGWKYFRRWRLLLCVLFVGVVSWWTSEGGKRSNHEKRWKQSTDNVWYHHHARCMQSVFLRRRWKWKSRRRKSFCSI